MTRWAAFKSCFCGTASGPKSEHYDAWLARERLRQLDNAEKRREELQRENYTLEVQLGQAMNILESYQSFTGNLDAMHRASSGLLPEPSDRFDSAGIEEGPYGSFSFTQQENPPPGSPDAMRASASPRTHGYAPQPSPPAAVPATPAAPAVQVDFSEPVQPTIAAPAAPPTAPPEPVVPDPFAKAPAASAAPPASSPPASAPPPAGQPSAHAIVDMRQHSAFARVAHVAPEPLAGAPQAYRHGYAPRSLPLIGALVDPPPSRSIPPRVAQLRTDLHGAPFVRPPTPRGARQLYRKSQNRSLADKVQPLARVDAASMSAKERSSI